MIEIVGHKIGPELDAAEELQQSIAARWPDVADKRNRLDQVRIVVGGQVFGGRVQDVDLAVIASLDNPRSIASASRRTIDDEPYNFRVQNFCIVIELKDATSSNVRFTGSMVEVRYDERWKNATHQNRAQVLALKALIENIGVRPPYIYGLVWLRNVPDADMPPFPTNIFAGHEPSWYTILDVCDSSSPNMFAKGMNDGASRALDRVFDVLGRTREPTALDRLRMDHVLKDVLLPSLDKYVAERELIIRGRAGAGKTSALLQLAYSAYEKRRARVLLLTYNRALVADVRRQLDLLGVPIAAQNRGIRASTVHSFFSKWLLSRALDLGYSISADEGADGRVEPFFDQVRYDTAIVECMELFKAGLLTGSDIEAAKAADPQDLSWDLICVDEGQDWPVAERDLLRQLYGATRIIVADGYDQLVRAGELCHWDGELRPEEWHLQNVPTCLRMATGLVQFTNRFAEELGLHNWYLEPQNRLTGGRVIVYEREYFNERGFHDELRRENSVAGNKGIDMLFCVPPSWVEYSNGVGGSHAASRLLQWKEKVWDGSSSINRVQFPTDVEQLRIVQYESSRGLEGWTVVNFALDDFYEVKLRQYEPEERRGFAIDNCSEARKFAGSWVMIPLTRAMHCLVITLSEEQSRIKEALTRVRERTGDLIEWRR
jgi:AAA domain